jgi:hypothetical protein
VKYILIACWMIVLSGIAQAQKSPDTAKVSVGPWQIDASFTEEKKLDRCSMSRMTKEGVEARFTREKDGLSLLLNSPSWQLEKGKTYPVEFVAGSTHWKADVSAASDSVRVALTDKLFNDALKNATSLQIRAAGKTISVPLNKSSMAFERLERCYQINNKAGDTNPFIEPKP